MTMTYTRRQQNEADVYNERAIGLNASLRDDELVLDPSVIPYPNREHVEFLDHLFGIAGDLTGKRMLEVGCGSGILTSYFALNGAQAVGVDVSEGMVGVAARRAEVNGVADRVEFRVAPIETMDDPDGSFDYIFANQVLHHLELGQAMANISRLLAPNGRALFAEPVWLLPSGVRQARYSKPVLRFFPSAADTPDERPLTLDDLEGIKAHFGGCDLRYHQLTTRTQNFRHLSDETFARLERIDQTLLRLPLASRAARYVSLSLSPKPPTNPERSTT
jgi:2-polyprenyl-3-methyl-5-hydroxy-6-metoxy-1,4-benzoquinol methylase